MNKGISIINYEEDNKETNKQQDENDTKTDNIYNDNLKKTTSQSRLDNNMESIFSNYFSLYLNKFDNFSNQLHLANVALEVLTKRIEKVSGKLNVVDDFFKNNSKQKELFLQKFDKLNRIDSKLSKLEVGTQSLVSKIADFDQKVNKTTSP